MKLPKPLVFIGLMLQAIPQAQALEPGATLPRTHDLPDRLPGEGASPVLDVPLIQLEKPSSQNKSAAKFILRVVRFKGNTVFEDAELQKVINSWLGKPISLIDLESIRFELAQHYRQAGYINSGVLLPEQHIRDGCVQFQIVEGHLGAINIQGTEGLVDRYIQNRLKNEENEPLNQQQLLDRFQTLLNDPLIERLNGTLKPGASPGEALLDLQVKRRQPYALTLSADNYTPPSVGAYTGRLDGVVRNLTGWGDFLDLNLNYSEGLEGLGSLFSLPIAASGTRLNLNFQGSHSKIIDNSLRSLNIENDFYHFSAGFSHPLYVTAQRNFTLEGQFAYRYTRSAILNKDIGLSEGSQDNGKTTVSVFRFSQNYLDRTPERVFSARSTFNFGTDLLGATTNHNLPDSRFFSWLGQLRFVHQIGRTGSEIFFRGDVQLASTSLLPLERFALGGVYTVRGYRQNELVRDNAYVLATEFRYPLLTSDIYAGHSLKLVPFIDYGQAWNYKISGQTLWSMGLGLQWNWSIIDAELYWARAMNKVNISYEQHDLQDNGIHFRMSLKLL